ncbi:RING/U-box superfamily protein [Tasmannia lanceolata]|uniref:RING/U-box superfamily protein n=1 Tax=Tasmannia lanceolata TaxID=3420 RepID=UPI004063A4FE
MASESDSETSFLEQLIRSRNRDISYFFPLILGIMGSPRSETLDPDQETQQTQERVILINPFTQGMIILQGGRTLETLVREMSAMESGKSGPPPASKASIEAMPTVEIEDEGLDCTICLDGFVVGEKGREMPCKHRFHSNCIEKWLGLHGSCPVCRFKMPVDEEEKKQSGERDEERGIWVSFSLDRRDSSGSERSDEQ